MSDNVVLHLCHAVNLIIFRSEYLSSNKCGIGALPHCQSLCVFVWSASNPNFHFKPPVCLASMASRVGELRQPRQTLVDKVTEPGVWAWNEQPRFHSPAFCLSGILLGVEAWDKQPRSHSPVLCLYSGFHVL